MLLRRFARPAIAGALLLTCSGAASAQGNRQLAALAGVERGQWHLKPVGAGGTERRLCLANPAALLQIRHGNAQCSQFVVENSATTVTIHYTCPGRGHGRTTVSVETPRLLRIDTQGVADGAPFAEELEGRRTGACN